MSRKSARVLPVAIALLAVLTLSVSTTSAKTVLKAVQSVDAPISSTAALENEPPETLGSSSDGDPDTLGGAQQAVPEFADTTNGTLKKSAGPRFWGQLMKIFSKYTLGLTTGR